jgi:hypothetical protein
LGPNARGQGHWFVRAVFELDGHENHFAVAEIFQIVNLEFVFSVALVPRFAGLVGVFDRSAIMHMLAAAPAGY